jgi:multimeric flavodoxin WrbA
LEVAKIQILGIVGSMRRNKNTQTLVETCLNSAREADKNVKTELVHILDVDVGPCKACYEECAETPYNCVVKDGLQMLMNTMARADAIVLGSPKYCPIPSKLVALIERLIYLAFFTEMRHPTAKHVLADKPSD